MFRLARGLVVEHFGDQSLVLVDINHLITLNRAGGDLAEVMVHRFRGRGFEVHDLTYLISEVYGLPVKQARQEAQLVVEDWIGCCLLQRCAADSKPQ